MQKWLQVYWLGWKTNYGAGSKLETFRMNSYMKFNVFQSISWSAALKGIRLKWFFNSNLLALKGLGRESCCFRHQVAWRF